MKTIKIFTITILLFLITAGQAWAANTWTVSQSTSGNTTTFTITRSGNTSIAETVRYKTVSVSALDGIHFTGKEGTLTFAAGDTQKDITVTEKPADQILPVYRYSKTSHYYQFEVDDFGGNKLASTDRHVGCDIEVYTFYLFHQKTIKATDILHINDGGYGSNPHYTFNATDFYDNSRHQLDYLKFIKASYRLTVGFYAKEVVDGYEYIQILINNTSGHDSGASNGNPGEINKSRYMAGFSIHGDGIDEYKRYFFPELGSGHNCGKVENAFGTLSGNYWGDLMQQYFNPEDCRSSDGMIIIPDNFETVTVRFDASGWESDSWYLKDLEINILADDFNNPTVLDGKDGVRISGGRHSKGNMIYVSIPFSEMVAPSSQGSLRTSWGDLPTTSNPNLPTNVISFAGPISSDATGNFSIISLNGTAIQDMSGRSFEDVLSSYGEFNISLDPDVTYSISYDLADGSGATDNPTTYQYVTPAFTLTNPTRTGYFFDGWTGSNGGTPQTTVTVDHSTGDLNFTANWTDVWGMADGADGSEQRPYTITSVKGLEMLAAVVNGLYENVADDLSGKFFVLGSDISYAYNSTWDEIGNTENNAIIIGDNTHFFLGSFNGAGYTISGIRLYAGDNTDDNDYIGLFGKVGNGGVIKNVTLADTRITGRNYVGSFVGDNAGTIDGCNVADIVSIHNIVSGSENHGGIAGRNTGTVQNCISRAKLSSSTASSNYGAIAGKNSSVVKDCIVMDATIFDATCPGVIVGLNDGGSLQNNYYNNCILGTRISGIGTGSGDIADNDGAVHLFHITTGDFVTASGAATITSDGENYYKANTNITLSCNVPQGYTFQEFSVTKNGTNPVEAVDVIENEGVYTFNMPSNDVTAQAVFAVSDWTVLVQGVKDGVTAWWGTFYSSTTNYNLSEGAAAYMMDSNNNLYLVGDDGSIIPKGTAVVILSTVSNATFAPNGNDDLGITVTGNILHGSDDAVTVTGGKVTIGSEDKTPYVLSVNGTGATAAVGFYKYEGSSIPGHRAFLAQ